MSDTLGEKLRKARENRGISISQVSEQTRIASHHLSAIEENDFSGLPGGIFNKGFVKSFAKCVGVDEQEALNDYNSLMASMENQKDPDELYTPEVLTDDRGGPSMASTVVLIALILAVLIGALIGAIYWLSSESEPSPSASGQQSPQAGAPAATEPVAEPTPMPDGFSVEISAREKIIDFDYEYDGVKVTRQILKPGDPPLVIRPKEIFIGRIYRTVVPSVMLKVNNVEIVLRNNPTERIMTVPIPKEKVAEIVSSKVIGDLPAEERPADSAPAANRPPAPRTQRPNANGARTQPTPAPTRTVTPSR